MSCVLSIAGKNLDIDKFILKSGLKGFVKRYKSQKDDSQNQSNGKLYSFVSATVSKAGLNDFEKQIKDVIKYLKANKKKLVTINETKEIEFATLNFMVSVNSVSKEYFAQYLYIPSELTTLCGNLNLGIEISVV